MRPPENRDDPKKAVQVGREKVDLMAARRASYRISSPLLGKHADLSTIKDCAQRISTISRHC